jgi:hypothetical protein
MRRYSPFIFALVMFLVVIPIRAQEHYNEGTISRVVLIKIKPGHFDAFMQDLRDNLRPVYDQEKQEGLILDYKIYLNSTSDSPTDWDLALTFEYKNYGALDGLAAKIQELTLKHYGSKGARQDATAKRFENAEVVASRLMRQITLK